MNVKSPFDLSTFVLDLMIYLMSYELCLMSYLMSYVVLSSYDLTALVYVLLLKLKLKISAHSPGVSPGTCAQ